MKSYIAVVRQPTNYNVFKVDSDGRRERILQSTGCECVAFAKGYATAVQCPTQFVYCEAGDAAKLEWRS